MLYRRTLALKGFSAECQSWNTSPHWELMPLGAQAPRFIISLQGLSPIMSEALFIGGPLGSFRAVLLGASEPQWVALGPELDGLAN